MQERRQLAFSLALQRRLELLAHEIVVDRLLEGAEHAERHGAVGLEGESREGER